MRTMIMRQETRVTFSRTQSERVSQRLNYWLRFADTNLLELQSLFFTAGWALWVLVPGWSHLDNLTMFKPLMAFVNQTSIGLFVLLSALLQTVGLAGNSVRLRKLGNMLSFMIWLYLFVMGCMSPNHPPSAVLFLILGISTALVYLRVGRYYVMRAG